MANDAEIVIGIRGDVGGARTIKRSLDDVSNSAYRATGQTEQLEKQTKSLASAQNLLRNAAIAAVAAIGGFSIFSQSTRLARDFSDSMAEVSTLVDDATWSMKELTKEVREQSKQFGSQPVQQAQALYQIISAGAKNAADATNTLTVANKLAVGGVTDVATAADGLTSILNAYGDKVENAQAVSDSLFVAMRAGKTTIEALASRLGRVAPIAASVGVSFDELTASISALTKGGISTEEAVTGVRAILAALAKPTSEATKLAGQLGINFSAAGLEAQGLAGFLDELVQKTGGSTAKLAQLFGGVEALVPIMALTGEAGVSFNEILADMATKAGQTEEAFNKIVESPGFKMDRALAIITDKAIDFGDKILTYVAPAALALAENLDTLLKIVGVLIGTSLPFLIKQFAITLPAAIAATSKAMTALTIIIAANPIGAIAVAVSAAISALFLFRKEIFEAVRDVKIGGVEITDVFFGIKNTAIEVFKGLVDIISLPMNLLVAKFKKIIAELKIAANNIPGVNLNITTQDRAFAELSSAEIKSRITNQTLQRTGGTFTRSVERTRQDIAEFEKLGKITDDIGLTDTGLGTPPPSTGDSPLSKEVEKVTKQIKDPMTDAVKDFADTIDRDFAKAFKDAFSGTDGGFKRLVEGMKASFTNFLGEIAYQAAARPILMSLGVVSGGMAGAGAAQAGGLSGLLGGASGGGFSLGNLGSMASSFLNGGLYSSTLGNIGANIGGMFSSNGLLSSSAFIGSQALGNLGYGAIGGGIASLLGLGGGIGGTIGGTLGSVAGGGIGASLGTIAGFAGGPVGALVGSFLGTALGGLFGGSKPSDKAQSAFVNLSTGKIGTSGQSGDKFSQENRDFADKVIEEAGNLAKLLQSAGAVVSGSTRVVIGSRDGLRLGRSGREKNFGNNTDAFLKAVSQSVIDNIVSAPEDLQAVLKNVSGFDTKSIAEAVGILELVRSFEDAGEASQPLKDALDALDAQFDELASKAAGLGLPIDKLTESYQKQKDAIIRDTLAPLQQFLDQQALSSNSTFSPTERLSISRSRFDEVMSQIGMGDFSNIGNVTNLASSLLSAGRDVFASGEGFSSLERFVRESVAGVGTSLGAPSGSLETGLAEMAVSNAEQVSLSQQMLVELQALREENRRLRKSMERVGNAVMTS